MPQLEGMDKYTACATCSNARTERAYLADPDYHCALHPGQRPRCVVRRRGKRAPDGGRWRTNVYDCPDYATSEGGE